MRYLDMQIINIRELNRNTGEIVHPFIVLDEGYNFIDPDYPVALQFCFLWYKRIRKYWGAIWFLTQNLSDVFGNDDVVSKTSAIIVSFDVEPRPLPSRAYRKTVTIPSIGNERAFGSVQSAGMLIQFC